MYYLNVESNPLTKILNAPMRYITDRAVTNGSAADLRLQLYLFGTGSISYDLDTIKVVENKSLTGEKCYLGMYDENASLLTSNMTLSVDGKTGGEVNICYGIIGDVNCDGAIDTGDSVTILKQNVELISFTVAQKVCADPNFDGRIDTGDAVAVLRYCVGLDK